MFILQSTYYNDQFNIQIFSIQVFNSLFLLKFTLHDVFSLYCVCFNNKF